MVALRKLIDSRWWWVAALALLTAAFVAGYFAHRPATIVKTVEGQERVVTKETVVVKPVTEWKERVVYRERLAPTGQVVERTETHETSGSRSEGSTTETKVKDDLRVKETVKVTDAPRLHAFAEVGPTLSLATGQLGVSAVAGVTYRVLGPVYVGGTVIVPVVPKPLPPTLQAVIGVGL